jgi:hypothetical protein
MPRTLELPKPIQGAVAGMLSADGVAVACNFSEDASGELRLDRPLRVVLGWRASVAFRGQLQIAGLAAAFTAHIEPDAIRTLAATLRDGAWITSHLCKGHLRGTRVPVHASCAIAWQLDDRGRDVTSAIIAFRTRALGLMIPPQLSLH